MLEISLMTFTHISYTDLSGDMLLLVVIHFLPQLLKAC